DWSSDVCSSDLQHEARADAGEEDHHVELARKQTLAEAQHVRVLFQGHLAHGRRDQRATAVPLDELYHLLSHPAFKGGHTQACEPDPLTLNRHGRSLLHQLTVCTDATTLQLTCASRSVGYRLG